MNGGKLGKGGLKREAVQVQRGEVEGVKRRSR